MWAWRLHGAFQASSTNFTTVFVWEVTDRGYIQVCITQPHMGRPGPGTHACCVPEPLLLLLPGYLHMYLGCWCLYDWEVEGRGCMAQVHTLQTWASEQAAVCVEGPWLIALDLSAPALEPLSLLHGLHK